MSATQALPGWVVEHGMANLDGHVATAHGIIGAHPLSMALGPMDEEAKADPMIERGRECHRGHIALVLAARRLGARFDEMGAGSEAVLTIYRLETDQSGPVRRHEARALRHDAAHKVLGTGQHSP